MIDTTLKPTEADHLDASVNRYGHKTAPIKEPYIGQPLIAICGKKGFYRGEGAVKAVGID
jgi:hypothetical protein